MIDWIRYIQKTYDDSAVSANFNSPIAIELERGSTKVKAKQELLSAVRGSKSSSIVIWGRPGSGKSYLLDSISWQLADDLMTEISNTLEGDYIPTSTSIIPIHIRLRLFDANSIWSDSGSLKLEALIKHKLELAAPLRDFLFCGPRFVVLIDDLDEVVKRNFVTNVQEVRNFIERYRGVQFIIAGRKVATRILDHSRHQTYRVCELSLDSIQQYMNAHCKPPKEYLYEQFTFDDSLAHYLSTPWYAVNAVNYWNQPKVLSETFRLGNMLYRLTDELIYRQVQTEASENIERVLRERVKILQEHAFSLMCQNRTSFSWSEVETIADLAMQWFQHMEFITQAQTMPEFVSCWVQAIFAVGYIKDRFTTFAERAKVLEEKLKSIDEVTTAFIKILIDVTAEDYSYFLQDSTKYQQLSVSTEELLTKLLSLEFEQSVYDYFSGPMKCKETRRAVREEKVLGKREIDIYAIDVRNEYGHEDIYVVECKYRIPPYNASIRKKEIEQLLDVWAKVKSEESRVRENRSSTYTVFPILFVTGIIDQRSTIERFREQEPTLWEKIRDSKMKIWQIHIPVETFLRGQYKILKKDIQEVL